MNDNHQVHNQKEQQQINLSDYEQASSQQIIVEFARNSYPLIGAMINNNVISGKFGQGEIQQPRNERLVMLRNGKLKLIQTVSKIIITKSIIRKKDNNELSKNVEVSEKGDLIGNLGQDNNDGLQKNVNQPQQQMQNEIQEEQRFFSQSSKSSDQQQRQQRQAKNMIKKRAMIKKSTVQKPSRINKNILKKKLKFLSSKS